MPNIRGRFCPEVESTGRAKKYLDVLLWGATWSQQHQKDLDSLDVLRGYVHSIRPACCDIRIIVPETHGSTMEMLSACRIQFLVVPITKAVSETSKLISEKELGDAVQTALRCDADVLAVGNVDWLPYAEEIDSLGLFLTDTGFVNRYCEIFVRGHDIPWAFSTQIWGQPWNGFYQMSEPQTFSAGTEFLYQAHGKGVSGDAQETGRSLLHNRLPNICFTRDRLLFYDMQKMAALRAKWKRQEYAFELSYYLKFYYPLIFGGFDHAALLVNQCLQLGLSERNVGASYGSFLNALKAKSPAVYAIFTNPKHVEFIKRVAYLRHYASHRGSLAPAKLIEKPEKELTNDDLDSMIAAQELDELLTALPAGEMRDSFRETLRYNVRMSYYEKEGKVVEGVVPIEIDGKFGFIRPANETYWNFQNRLLFINQVFAELTRGLCVQQTAAAPSEM